MAAHHLKLNRSKTLYISGDASPCQDFVITLKITWSDNACNLGYFWTISYCSFLLLLNWIGHIGFSFTTSGGSKGKKHQGESSLSGNMTENFTGLNVGNAVGSAEKENAGMTEALRQKFQWHSKPCLNVATVHHLPRNRSSEMSLNHPQSPALSSSFLPARTTTSPDFIFSHYKSDQGICSEGTALDCVPSPLIWQSCLWAKAGGVEADGGKSFSGGVHV